MAAFRAWPRPARAFPNSVRLAWIAARVGSSKVLKTWSISTGSGVAALSGIVEPGSKPSSESPRWISRYLRPSAERERTITVESTGSGSRSWFSSMSTSALTEPSSFWTGSMVVIAPTRMPPIADLVAGHHGVGVGDLGRELVGRDEGQALVRLVGEEDGDDDDEHGDGADQGRAGGEAAGAPAPHAEPPEQELEEASRPRAS